MTCKGVRLFGMALLACAYDPSTAGQAAAGNARWLDARDRERDRGVQSRRHQDAAVQSRAGELP